MLPQPTDVELASFRMLKENLSLPVTLVHYSSERVLWIDLDASKKFGFGVIVFHTAEDYKIDTAWPPRTSIQPIMFLSCLLTDAERNYWPTELDFGGFVWVVKKIRHCRV